MRENHFDLLAAEFAYELLDEQTVHELKVWTEYFDALDDRSKPFEVRKNDRDYKVGDVLYLKEYDLFNDAFTGRYLYKEVTYILPGGEFGIDPEYVVMGLANLD